MGNKILLIYKSKQLNTLKYPRFLSRMIKTNLPLVCPLCFFLIFAVLDVFLCHHCSPSMKGRTVMT